MNIKIKIYFKFVLKEKNLNNFVSKIRYHDAEKLNI